MIDLTATASKLAGLALETAPTDAPWALLHDVSGKCLLAYRENDDTGELTAVLLTDKEDPRSVYKNISQGVDNRRRESRESIIDTINSGITVIQSPAVNMFVLFPEDSDYPPLLALATEESVATINVSAKAVSEYKGFVRDDVLEKIVFK